MNNSIPAVLAVAASLAVPTPPEPVAVPIPDSGPTLVLRDVSSRTHPGLEEKIDRIWEFVKVLGVAPEGLPAPVVRLASFDPAKEDPAFSRWRVEWAKDYPEVELPFRKDVKGYHYMKTNVIQVGPEHTFFQFYLPDPDTGRRRDIVGKGYYVVAHEMLHYVWEARGIPGETHHCLMTRGNDAPMARVVDFLADERIASASLRFHGLAEERRMRPCERISETMMSASAVMTRLAEFSRYALAGKTAGSCPGLYRDGVYDEELPPAPGAALHPLVHGISPDQVAFVYQRPAAPQDLIHLPNGERLADVFSAALVGTTRYSLHRGVAAFTNGRGGTNEVRYLGVLDLKTKMGFIAGNGTCAFEWPRPRS